MDAPQRKHKQIDYIDDLSLDKSLWRTDVSREEALAFFELERREASLRPDYPAILEFKKRKSMLHPDTLIMLRALASVVKGPIVEFGTYIGGSTAMIAKGCGSDGRFLAVELGGSYLDHPHLPSSDIFGEMQETLCEQDVEQRVQLIQDFSSSPATRERIEKFLNGEKIAMLVIDTDGAIKRDVELYAPYCAKGCVLVIDDYIDLGEDDYKKADTVRAAVDGYVESGDFVRFDVLKWGTWFGRMA